MFDGRRVRVVCETPPKTSGRYVLYWMTAARRTRYNNSLQRAVDWSVRLNKPLVVIEALSIDYPWASVRHHQFIIDGMADQHQSFLESGAAYYGYVERESRGGRGLVLELSQDACVVVTDDFPCFFLPKIVSYVAQQVTCHMESVDANGVLPMNAAGKSFTSAYQFRRYMQRHVVEALSMPGEVAPLSRLAHRGLSVSHIERLKSAGVKSEILKRWQPTPFGGGPADAVELAGARLNTSVAALSVVGGARAGAQLADVFINRRLNRYTERRNRPEETGTSGLSPYLHFGHVASIEVVIEMLDRHGFEPKSAQRNFKGQRAGFWLLPEPVEAFLDQIITWRELGYGFCNYTANYDAYETLPGWALKTMEEHRQDPRPYVYDHEAFDMAQTHDPLWNAAQNQLRRDGRIHNYLRMLWGKKILHWSESPEHALRTMIELNNRYALDGRNPNSYSGIFWTLGRFDRAWGPERPVFGKVRYMTSQSTARKFSVGNYIAEYSHMAQGRLF
jgi:deoxyribodipyrimidine photo-lyase